MNAPSLTNWARRRRKAVGGRGALSKLINNFIYKAVFAEQLLTQPRSANNTLTSKYGN